MAARGPVKELKVEDALLYLDQVKSQFQDQPNIYNKFLDIMKNFKAQAIDTPGVIKQVSQLFRGYPKLILGFNTFLPPGFKIRPEDAEMAGALPPAYPPPPLPPVGPTPSLSPSANHRPPDEPNRVGPAVARQPPPPTAGPGAPPGNAQQPVEFDHAIHYVTTIKRRFNDQPEVYKSFLEILHTYQKEQRSIKQVLEQVSELFRDHPDLLKEFTYFLPDAVQEQAKEKLNKAAQKAIDRKNKQAAAAKKKAEEQKSAKQPSEKADRPQQREKEANREKEKEKEREREREREREEREREREARRAARRERKRAREARLKSAFEDSTVLASERRFFENVKATCASREQWHEFLKCLDLFSQELLTRQEMLSLVGVLLEKRQDLLDEFKRILNERGVSDSAADVWYSMPLAEIDLSQCRRCTPSYRGLPSSYPVPPSSEREELEKSVCNDEWVSVPTGSEDFSFKNMRKNQYEEALFKCEDERFEIDMVIDSNAATIRILEPLAEEIQMLKDKEAKGDGAPVFYRLDKRTFGTIHLNAIARIYGEHGNEVLELLRKNPAGAIPVILQRLRQKDEEWRKARQDLNKQWKEVLEKNFHKSLDHRSFYFKQSDKKHISNKFLLAEAKAKLEESLGKDENQATNGPVPDAMQTDESGEAKEKDGEVWSPHFQFKYPVPSIHRDVHAVLSYAAEMSIGNEKERVMKLWREVFLSFFNLPEEWLRSSSGVGTAPASADDALKPGTDVETPYGPGVVDLYRQDDSLYIVKLPFGIAYVQPSDIKVEKEEEFPQEIPVADEPGDQRPVPSYAPVRGRQEILIGNANIYIFFRLHQKLYDRLLSAKEACDRARRNRNTLIVNPAARAIAEARAHDVEGDDPKDKQGDYQTYLAILYALLDNSMDNSRYEDSCRSLMGTASYLLFTMDKLLSHMLKHLQTMASDETCVKLCELYRRQREGDGGVLPNAYIEEAKAICKGDEGFRIQFKPGVRRLTPLAPDALVGAGKVGGVPSWLPSPRARRKPPCEWLVEPTLQIECLGSLRVEEEPIAATEDAEEVKVVTEEKPRAVLEEAKKEEETKEEKEVEAVKEEALEEGEASEEQPRKKRKVGEDEPGQAVPGDAMVEEEGDGK